MVKTPYDIMTKKNYGMYSFEKKGSSYIDRLNEEGTIDSLNSDLEKKIINVERSIINWSFGTKINDLL